MSLYYDAFISYGRADSKAFAIKLYQNLTKAGFKIWFDQNDIPLAVDFQNQIDDGIERAHNFLFIIAPHSVNSPYCLKEIERAVKYKKRIIPLLHVEQITQEIWQQRNPAKTDKDWEECQQKGLHSSFANMHPEIGRINWVYFRENVDNYDESFAGLIKTFNHREDYVQKHTQILVKSLEWERHQKLTRYLLIGKERLEAEDWLKIEFKNEQPPCIPTDLQCEFICESIKNANNLLTQVFLIYAKEDRETMLKIRNSFMGHGITVWTSQTDIKTGGEFKEAIKRGIEGADNLVYLLSSEALKSEYCQQELAQALSLNKRIISVLVKPTDLATIPKELQELQFLDLTDGEEERKNLDKLIKELRENAVYYEQHKVLLVKALKWQEQNRNPSILLRGYNLEHYKSWLEVARTKKLHPATDLQEQFITESAKQPPDLVLDVFISYSRADSDFARRLNHALQTQGKTTWFDQESIATGTDFQSEIYRGIEQSDNFLFVISPDAVNSQYCADEVEYARGLNKRFVTVLHRQVNSEELHPELAKVQWLDFNRHGGDFYGNFSELVRTLDTDREYVREHTKKSQMALEWKRGNKTIDLLLRGREYARAYEWFREVQGQKKQPAVNEEIEEFILESKAEVERLEKAQRRRKNTIAAAAVGTIVVLSGLSVVAWGQKVEAERQSEIALARQLAAESRISTAEDGFQQRGTLLAVESMRKFQKLSLTSVTADNALRNGLSLLPHFISQMNHDKQVRALVFSADGKFVATASSDGSARVWEVSTGLEVAKLNHDSSLDAIAFSPDDRYIATASFDKTARLWEVATSKEVAKLNHDGAVTAVAFSPDGKFVATGSADQTARVWDATTGEEVAKLNRDGAVNFVAFTPDGKFVVTADEKTARVWDAIAGKEVAKLDRDGGTRSIIAFSADGKFVATASFDKTARLWDVNAGEELAEFNRDRIDAIAFSADGNYIATASFDKTARLWEAKTGKEVARLKHDRAVRAIAFSPDSNYIATASADKTARLWDSTTGEEVARLNDDYGISAVAFSPDGKYLATVSYVHSVRVWAPRAGSEVVKLNHDGGANAVAFSPDGKFVATASQDKTARVWSATRGQEVAKLNHDDKVIDVAFSPDGKFVATISLDNTARVWSATSGQKVANLNHDRQVIDVAFSPDGKYVATASFDKTARLWDATTGREVVKLNHDRTVNAVTFSADGQFVATASNDKTARVWSATTGEEVVKLNHDFEVWTVAFSPDNQYVATATGFSNTAQIWSATTEREVAKLNHDSTVITIVFSPDGKLVATASQDKTARVWEATTGKEVARLNHDAEVRAVAFSPDGKYLATASQSNTATVRSLSSEVAKFNHDGEVWAVAFSPDGKYLATASSDKTARVHFLKPEDLIDEACSRLRRNLTAEEWERYMNLDLEQYHKTCDNLPVHPNVLDRGRELAKGGEVKEATAIFRRVLELEPDMDLDPDTKEIDNDPEAVARRLAGN